MNPEKPKKILMVEDDVAMRDIVIHKLLAHGFEVKEAENGKKGIDLILNEKPDLVLLDLMMPEVDGFQVLETVRKNTDNGVKNTPIIILSNLWSNKDILRAKDLQVQAYMVKAYFTTEEILNKINEILLSVAKEKNGSASAAPTPPITPPTPPAPTPPTA